MCGLDSGQPRGKLSRLSLPDNRHRNDWRDWSSWVPSCYFVIAVGNTALVGQLAAEAAAEAAASVAKKKLTSH